MNRRTFIKGILAIAVIPQIPFVGVEEVIEPFDLIAGVPTGQHYTYNVYDDIVSDEDKLVYLLDLMKTPDVKWFEFNLKIPTGRTA